MRNIFLEISYNGAGYHGWQVQDNAVTVQQVLQDAIYSVFQKRENIIGCSRTDSGVHANIFCCNFRTESNIPIDKIPDALNANLPRDIVVLSSKEVPLEFHSRYDCIAKEYEYRILNSKKRNPFRDGLCWFYPYDLDEKLMNEECKVFIGMYDFSAFCASKSSVEDKTRTIYDFSVRRENDDVIFTVKGNGFLYNMVRIMVGTLVDISRGKIEKDSIRNIILSLDRDRAGVTAPPEGLYLNRVFYDEV